MPECPEHKLIVWRLDVVEETQARHSLLLERVDKAIWKTGVVVTVLLGTLQFILTFGPKWGWF